MKTSKAKTPRAAKVKGAKSTAVNGNGIHPVAENSIEMVAQSAIPEIMTESVISAATPITPTIEQVRMRAYELYLERGATPGGELHDWIRAERELSEVRARP